jgi:hypothetical protein
MDVKGKTGRVELCNGRVTIHRKASVGRRSATGAREQRIPVEQIVAVHFKGASRLTSGTIRFVVADEQEGTRPDDTTVVFSYRQQVAFEALANAVARAIAAHHGNAVAV